MKTQITFTLTDKEFREIVEDGIDHLVRYSGPQLYNHRMTAIEQSLSEPQRESAWLVIYEPKPEEPVTPPPAETPLPQPP